jgi:hypothetical protein
MSKKILESINQNKNEIQGSTKENLDYLQSMVNNMDE